MKKSLLSLFSCCIVMMPSFAQELSGTEELENEQKPIFKFYVKGEILHHTMTPKEFEIAGGGSHWHKSRRLNLTNKGWGFNLGSALNFTKVENLLVELNAQYMWGKMDYMYSRSIDDVTQDYWATNASFDWQIVKGNMAILVRILNVDKFPVRPYVGVSYGLEISNTASGKVDSIYRHWDPSVSYETRTETTDIQYELRNPLALLFGLQGKLRIKKKDILFDLRANWVSYILSIDKFHLNMWTTSFGIYYPIN
jgi:hypothetical protein